MKKDCCQVFTCAEDLKKTQNKKNKTKNKKK